MDKTLEELQTIAPSDVTAASPKNIAAYVETVARGTRRARQFLRENRDLLRRDGRSLTFLRRSGALPFQEVSPGTDITTKTQGTYSYTQTTITVRLFGGYFDILRTTLEEAARDVIADIMEDFAIDIAEFEDEEIWKKILDSVEVTGETVISADTVDRTDVIGTLANDKVLKIKSITSGVTLKAVDYYKGKIKVDIPANTAVVVDYIYSKRDAQAIDAKTAGSFKAEDVASMRNKIEGAYYQPRVFISHPETLSSLLLDERFKYSEAGIQRVYQGELGMMLGIRAITSTLFYPSIGLMADTQRLGWFIIKRNLETARVEKAEIDGIRFVFWTEWEVWIQRPEAMAIVFNISSDAASL